MRNPVVCAGIDFEPSATASTYRFEVVKQNAIPKAVLFIIGDA